MYMYMYVHMYSSGVEHGVNRYSANPFDVLTVRTTMKLKCIKKNILRV